MRCICGEIISSGRWEIGIKSCLRCGDRKAQSEIKEKLANVGPLFNKGGLGFLGTTKQAVEDTLNSNQRSVVVGDSGTTEAPVPKRIQQLKSRKPTPKPIGVVYMDGDRNGQFIYSLDDPKLKKCDRYALYPPK